MKLLKYSSVTIFVVALTACGGGGGGGGGATTSAIPVPSSALPVVANFAFQLTKNSLVNSGTDQVLLKVTALDANNNPVIGAALNVALDSGIYTPVLAVTDSSGQASGNISIGGNKSNRDIKATLTMSGKTTVVIIPVTGSDLTLTPVPASPTVGQPMKLTVKVTDINGNGIANTLVKFSGRLGFNQQPTTDSNGNATVVLDTAPNIAGNYSLDVTASGVTTSRDILVVNSSGTGIPVAVGTISSASLSVVPNTIAPNVSGSQVNRAGLRAVFLNSTNQAIQNVRVRFEIVQPGLNSGEKISTENATVYSDVSGVAVADYISGTRSSPTDGVKVRICYGMTDTEIANGACLRSKDTTLTVASQPLSITMGDNNELTKGGNNLTYIKKFDVAVADAAGNAVANAQLSSSVDLIRYGKGVYSGPRFSCDNEDTDRNGSLDTAEKNAGDGDNTISPRKADVVLSFVGANTTGINGRATIQVEYPQNVATWLLYKLKVTTSVAGSEGTVEKTYATSFVIGDESNGSFLTPPYGLNNCRTPN